MVDLLNENNIKQIIQILPDLSTPKLEIALKILSLSKLQN